MDEKLDEGAGAIVRRTSPNTKKTAKPKAAAVAAEEPAAPVAPTPKGTKAKVKPAAEAPAAPVAPTPKGTKAKAAASKAEAEAPATAQAATPKAPKPKATAGAAESANGTKAALRLTTAADSKGGLTAQENHSFVIDLTKVPKMLECNNPFRVFCNIPPGLLTEEQQTEFIAQIKKAGIDVLKYKKNMEQLHQQIGNRAKQNLMIYGWVPDENAVVPIFGEERFTYVFVYPNPLKVYHARLVAAKVEDAEAKAQALALKETYGKHLEKNEHVVVTARVSE